jgi:hypothetical protein
MVPPIRLIAAVLACAAVCMPAQGTELSAMDGATGCRLEMPSGWHVQFVRWSGPCERKVANGLGVLRGYKDGQVATTYYGAIKDGHLDIGIIETRGGFVAGRYAEGSRIDNDDPQSYIDAFRVASEAANQASETFRRSGNNASAKFYADKARMLARQMDD